MKIEPKKHIILCSKNIEWNIFFRDVVLIWFLFYCSFIVHAEPHYTSPYGHYDYDNYDNNYAYEHAAHAYSHY